LNKGSLIAACRGVKTWTDTIVAIKFYRIAKTVDEIINMGCYHEENNNNEMAVKECCIRATDVFHNILTGNFVTSLSQK